MLVVEEPLILHPNMEEGNLVVEEEHPIQPLHMDNLVVEVALILPAEEANQEVVVDNQVEEVFPPLTQPLNTEPVNKEVVEDIQPH